MAKRTGNEYLFQELATSNVDELDGAGVKKVITSCPHCLKTLGHDYREFGFDAEVIHSAVFVEELTRGVTPIPGVPTQGSVTYHDPCYLGRYAKTVDEPRALLARAGATVAEPERTKENPFCCGAGGGLLFERRAARSAMRATSSAPPPARHPWNACPFAVILRGPASADQAGRRHADRRRGPTAKPMVMPPDVLCRGSLRRPDCAARRPTGATPRRGAQRAAS